MILKLTVLYAVVKNTWLYKDPMYFQIGNIYSDIEKQTQINDYFNNSKKKS